MYDFYKDDKIWKEVKNIKIKNLVEYPEWQELRKSFLNTWENNCSKNVKKLKKFIFSFKDSLDFAVRVRIVFNYLNGTYFRINYYRICTEVKELNKLLKEIIHDNLILIRRKNATKSKSE